MTLATKRRSEVMVGSFITVGTGLFVLLLFLMGSLDFILAPQVTVEADFEDVQSLQPGDPVYVFGLKVGTVASLDIIPGAEGKRSVVRVLMRVPEKSRDWLRKDTQVKIDKTLTGTVSVWIVGGVGPSLPQGQRLRGTPSVDLGAVTEKVNQVLSEGESLINAISKIVSEIESQGSLITAIDDLAALVKDARSEIGPLRDNIREILSEVRGILDENRLDIRHTMANLKETSALAKSFTEKLDNVPDLLQGSLAEVQQAGSAAKDVLRENRSHIDTIIEDLRQTSTNAANLTAEIKRRPWRLLYKPSESEEEAMDLYDAAWAYNLGATELNRSVRDLADQIERMSREGYSAELLETAEDKVKESLRKYRDAEDIFWEKLRAGS
jgi:phospholipid/cholesterol/gamma-HCH transport system substrate-binding protein